MICLVWIILSSIDSGLATQKTQEDMWIVVDRDPDLCMIRDFITIAYDGLKRDPLSLANHLIGSVPNISDTKYPMMTGLLREACHWLESSTAPLLIPALPCLPSTLDICKMRIWGLSDIMQIEQNGHLGVMKNKDGTIEVWDIARKEFVFSLGVTYDKVAPNVYTSDLYVLTLNAMEMIVWEIESGSEIRKMNLGERQCVKIHLLILCRYTEKKLSANLSFAITPM